MNFRVGVSTKAVRNTSEELLEKTEAHTHKHTEVPDHINCSPNNSSS